MIRRTFATLVVLPALLAGSACGGGPTTSADRSRPITAAEASRIADVLLKNHDAGGATLVATVPFGVATFTLRGQVDWTNHVGRVTVESRLSNGKVAPTRDLVWNPDVVFEEVPGLAEALAAQGRPAAHWVARTFDPSTSSLHLVLRLIDTASSIQRDNPVLLMSNGTRWLRRDSVDGTAVDVFRQKRTTSWVGRSDGRLHRLDAQLAATSSTASVTIRDFGPRTIPVPNDPDIVALDQVSDLYQRLVGGS